MRDRPTPRRLLAAAFLITGLASATAAFRGTGLPIQATLNDFFQPGTQPQTLNAPLLVAQNCSACHGFYDVDQEPYTRWLSSMMGQATRDPIFHACLAIAEQDMEFSGELCLRCHSPNGWLEGRSVPTDGSGLDAQLGDFDGVSCHFCHRLVDPIYDATANPIEDAGILAALGQIPPNPHSGMYVVDPDDRRRGPFDLGGTFFWHEWRESPFHRDSALCGTCHDVSNPAFTRQPDGTYALNAVDTPHPTHNKYQEFPVERTFTEWALSDFAHTEIEMYGRFGGNKTAVSTCQDCHMPDATGEACQPGFGGVTRNDLPMHDFNGANTWVLRAIRSLYSDAVTGLDQTMVDDSIARAVEMLENASDMVLFVENGALTVRVINQTGHKLPTGYGEGRRMWLNVRFLNAGNGLIQERGAYNPGTAVLTQDTTVFEIKHGLDAAMAAESGLPQGESFHFVLNNEVLKDNRIPPRGFTNWAFEAGQSEPVAAVYADQQYWSDSSFRIPVGTAKVQVTLYFQLTSKEYIEFLRDENYTNNAGQIAYDQWVLHGKSAPVAMDTAEIVLSTPSCPAPIAIGVPADTSQGSTPVVSSRGTPRLAVNDFRIRLDDSLPNAFGVLYWSNATTSERVRDQSGAWHLASPLQTHSSFQTDGNGSTGWISIPVTGAMVGTERYYQFVVKDSANPGGASHSTALHVDFCP